MSAALLMARTFTITCAAGTIRQAGTARGECTFTVTNSSAAAVRAQPTPVAHDAQAQGWLAVAGEPVRELDPGQTVQVTVAILPSGAPPGRYLFRLDVAAVGSSERSTGPEVCLELTSAAPQPLPGRGAFPWWILVVVGAVLALVIALVLWLTLRDRGAAAPAPAAAADGAAPASAGSAGAASADEAEELAQRWLAAYQRDDVKALTALTSAPALIAGERAEDERAIARLYAALLKQDHPAGARPPPARAPSRPVAARVRDLSRKLPPEAGKLGLDDDDHAMGVTIDGSPARLVLLIRHGPPARVAGVLR